MCERVAMASPSRTSAAHWWQRRSASSLVFLAVLSVLGLATMAVAGQVVDVLPEVAKDQLGEDQWTDPLGVELMSGFQVVHIPDCAAGSVTRIALWDAESKPYWEVAGPPTPMASFFVGAAPKGFLEVVKYREPPRGGVLRLVVFRRVGGVAGIRYKTSQLRSKRVVSGRNLRTYTVDGFQKSEVCGGTPADTRIDSETPTETDPPVDLITTTTLPG